MKDFLELAQALNAKFCHELSGSIGAIENCAELVDSIDNVIRDRAVGLIKSSSQKLINFNTSFSNFSVKQLIKF